jgi:hypothetical protein
MAYGVAYPFACCDGLRATQTPFDALAHVLGRIDQSNGLTGQSWAIPGDRPPDATPGDQARQAIDDHAFTMISRSP